MCICPHIYDRMLSSFSLLKNADSEQNIGFFGPESRSGPGGIPYKCREFIIEITKENEAFESIWVKITKSRDNSSYSTCFDHNSAKSMNFWVLFFALVTSRCVAVGGRERREHRRRKEPVREWRIQFAFRVACFVLRESDGGMFDSFWDSSISSAFFRGRPFWAVLVVFRWGSCLQCVEAVICWKMHLWTNP